MRGTTFGERSTKVECSHWASNYSIALGFSPTARYKYKYSKYGFVLVSISIIRERTRKIISSTLVGDIYKMTSSYDANVAPSEKWDGVCVRTGVQ